LKHILFLFAMLSAMLLTGCAGHSSHFKPVKFRAPSRPDPAFEAYLKDVDRIGVICVTNIEPFRELDVQKVMALLANATARGLSRLPETTIVAQDEIIWQLKDVTFDSTSVQNDTVRAALRTQMELDAIVFVELRHLQARVIPTTPTSLGPSPKPGMDLSVDLQVSFINLNTNQTWKQGGQERSFAPMRLQLPGGSNQGERQLLQALAQPMQRFLARVAPPPHPQIRHFEIGGD
jgi:hypothetical protein